MTDTAPSPRQQPAGPRFRRLLTGDPAPLFRQRTAHNPDFVFDSVAGRYIVLAFLPGSSSADGQRVAQFVAAERSRFDDDSITFFGVSLDPADEGRLKDSLPGVRWFFDRDLRVSRLYGAASLDDPEAPGTVTAIPRWVVIDPNLRLRAVLPFRRDGGEMGELSVLLASLPDVDGFAGQPLQAPVLLLPNVFEPELCQALIAAYDSHGGEMSGFMREAEGRTVLRHDPNHKRRRDHMLEDQRLIEATRERIRRRIAPEIARAYQFEVTRMERYLVGCYTAEDQGHFRAHRDNTTRGTAHRRFAVSINLTDDFDGGEVGFPEYGRRTWKPPIGGAVIFSCGLLHRVTPVTRGRRYAFLPFLYDEAAAKVRADNLGYLDLDEPTAVEMQAPKS